jgi:hypothetical protein
MKKPELIPHWKQSYKMLSQQAFFYIALIQVLAQTGMLQEVLQATVALLPPSMGAEVGNVSSVVNWLTAFLAVWGMWSRILAQPEVQEALRKAQEQQGNQKA